VQKESSKGQILHFGLHFGREIEKILKLFFLKVSALVFSWATYIIESFLLVPFFFSISFLGEVQLFAILSEEQKELNVMV